MNHPNNHDLQEFADNACDERTRSRISLHLQTCTDCRLRAEGVEKLGNLIRRIPAERTSKAFTERVMRKISVADSPSFLWFLLKNVAPVIGLVIVIGAVYTALTLTGILDASGNEQAGGTLTAVYEKIGGQLTSATSSFSEWFKRVFPFLYSKTSYSLIAMLVVIIIAALIDRYLLIPIFRRKV